MDKFLESYNLPRLNQDKRENIKRSITSTEIKILIKNLPKTQQQQQQQKKPHRDTDEFYQSLRRAGTYPAQTLDSGRVLQTKENSLTHSTTRKRKLQANISDVP